jgi:hypothetical protein
VHCDPPAVGVTDARIAPNPKFVRANIAVQSSNFHAGSGGFADELFPKVDGCMVPTGVLGRVPSLLLSPDDPFRDETRLDGVDENQVAWPPGCGIREAPELSHCCRNRTGRPPDTIRYGVCGIEYELGQSFASLLDAGLLGDSARQENLKYRATVKLEADL